MSEIIHHQQVFSLKEVLRSVQKTLSQRYQRSYWMKAEMNKLNFYTYSGHCYPDLVEKSEGKVVAQARAMIWKGDFQVINTKFQKTLKEPLKDGITILFLAKIIFTPVHGLSLQILDIDPSYSLGVLEQEKQETISRLQKEGIFNRNKALPFPLLPQNIAIISVETSKGYADFLKILRQNEHGYPFVQLLFPARLQGEMAVTDIIRQLRKIKQYADLFDVAVIIRGGGGDIGLSAFNAYNLAKEIACFPIPVLTGIGHATNETIAEMVAFRNAITPTECAQFLLAHFEHFDTALKQTQQKLAHQTQLQLNRQRETQQLQLHFLKKEVSRTLQRQSEQLNHNLLNLQKGSRQLIQTQATACLQAGKTLNAGVQKMIEATHTILQQQAKHLALVDPVHTLKRGFSITKVNGKAISPGDALPDAGTTIETTLYQGKIISTITQKEEKQNHHGKTNH